MILVVSAITDIVALGQYFNAVTDFDSFPLGQFSAGYPSKYYIRASYRLYQERIRGRSVQPIELSEPKVRRVRCKNLPYKEGFCRPHKTTIVALA